MQHSFNLTQMELLSSVVALRCKDHEFQNTLGCTWYPISKSKEEEEEKA